MLDFKLIGDVNNKEPMEKYMKNHFPFLGAKSPDRKKQSKEFIKESKQLTHEERLALVEELYARDEREYQYVAIDVCEAVAKQLTFAELNDYTHFIEEKSWWDSVDAWRKIYGIHIQKHPENKEKVFDLFYQHPNFWMRRLSIILQLSEKENTDEEMLTKSILHDLETDEFFIQKAIGWSLRQYSKTNPDWVEAFISEVELSPLAKREGLKQIQK